MPSEQKAEPLLFKEWVELRQCRQESRLRHGNETTASETTESPSTCLTREKADNLKCWEQAV